MKNGAIMQTIINNALKDMFDKLLEKALQTQPEFINNERINYDCLFIDFDRKNNEYYITYKGYDIIKNEYERSWSRYKQELTTHQKKMIDKIFKKWI